MAKRSLVILTKRPKAVVVSVVKHKDRFKAWQSLLQTEVQQGGASLNSLQRTAKHKHKKSVLKSHIQKARSAMRQSRQCAAFPFHLRIHSLRPHSWREKERGDRERERDREKGRDALLFRPWLTKLHPDSAEEQSDNSCCLHKPRCTR